MEHLLDHPEIQNLMKNGDYSDYVECPNCGTELYDGDVYYKDIDLCPYC